MRILYFPIAGILLLSSCVQHDGVQHGGVQHDDTNRPISNNKLLAAYSMLAPASDGSVLIYGRVIVDGVLKDSSGCPTIVSESGNTIKSKQRQQRPDPSLFPVTVCEAVLEPNVSYQVAYSNLKLAKSSLEPKNIQIFGDTGCKSKVCNTSAAEPFKTLASIAANSPPDLLLHMGDYNYRGTSGSISGNTYAYDAGDGGYGGKSCGLDETYYSQNSQGSPRPDSWANWNADFFQSTQALMGSAPWVFARGNHELCSRAGIGWFYLFGPGAQFQRSIKQQSCPSQGSYTNPPATAVEHIAMIEPYGLPLRNLNVWVFDSANACDELSTNQLTAQYTQQFEKLNTFAERSNNPTWVMTHRPIWGVNGVSPLDTINTQLQVALSKTKQKALSDKVALSLSGHMHLYQSVTPNSDSGRPAQIVVGNSGVSLSNTTDNQSVSVTLDGVQSIVNTQGKFGYLKIQLKDNALQWQGEMIGENAKAFLVCDPNHATNGKAICEKLD
ncbi:metallophosphoesterase [Pseudoalteromonas sp. S16_S37]|uniref:metallophosphoesterase n=1 Tax=Pseudoalteromonas sp. S16_S37 TaxID=2720228 RepID=UPI0016802E70|nr:metallophosphoesterase [Pseudoalteromonas sp. S16_S37]MBD1582656.1 metallophosphoesterase [Pseudoalteromonas sp. S16_S37]